MNIFKTYKAQYEEAVSNNASLQKQVEDLKLQLASITVPAPLISVEDLEKLKAEHASAVSLTKELTEKVKQLEASKVDVDTAAMQKAIEVLGDMGVKQPVASVESKDTDDEVNPYLKVLYRKK